MFIKFSLLLLLFIIIIIIIIIVIIIVIVTIKGTHYKMDTIFMNTKNSKMNELHRFRLDLRDKLNLKNPKKNMALAN